jgi:hypothetical protein
LAHVHDVAFVSIGLLTLPQVAAAADPTLYGLIQTPSFNELTVYDPAQINDSGFSGYNASSLAPLNITTLLPQNSITSIAAQGSTAYGLISTPSFDELTAYDTTQVNNSSFSGYDERFVAPLNITNLLLQNSITSIAVQGTSLYGLITTPSFNELTLYDTAQVNDSGFSGFDAIYLAPLNITNLLPQNSISSIAVQGTTLYALITTPSFNELATYDLTEINKSGFSGFDATSLAPLNITNLLPQNSITSIAVDGSTLYGLIMTPDFNELTTYDLTQINKSSFFGYDATSVAPLNITNLLPQNSIVAIAVTPADSGGGGSGSAPEPSSRSMMTIGFLAVGSLFRRRVSRRNCAVLSQRHFSGATV